MDAWLTALMQLLKNNILNVELSSDANKLFQNEYEIGTGVTRKLSEYAHDKCLSGYKIYCLLQHCWVHILEFYSKQNYSKFHFSYLKKKKNPNE